MSTPWFSGDASVHQWGTCVPSTRRPHEMVGIARFVTPLFRIGASRTTTTAGAARTQRRVAKWNRGPGSLVRPGHWPDVRRVSRAGAAGVLCSRRRYGDERRATPPVAALDETEIRRVLPDRQARARGPPRLHRLGVWPLARADRLEEVEDQVVDGFGHGIELAPCGLVGSDQYPEIDLTRATANRR